MLYADDIPRAIMAAVFENSSDNGATVDEVLALLADLLIIRLSDTTVTIHQLMQQAMTAAAPCMVAAVSAVVTA